MAFRTPTWALGLSRSLQTCSNIRTAPTALRQGAIGRRSFTSSQRCFAGRQPLPDHYKLSEQMKTKNRTAMYYTVSVIIGTLAVAYSAVPLYKMVCQQTGWGGQPISTHLTEKDPASRVKPVTNSKRIKITFNSTVSDVLPWKFYPEQREVRVLPGETALAFYKATNKSDKDIVGMATYSVTPGQASPYFSKIQCFCFEEQRLNAGETVDMPVFFFIDPDFVNDPAMRGIDTITLSYTFFKAKYDSNGVLKPVPGAPVLPPKT